MRTRGIIATTIIVTVLSALAALFLIPIPDTWQGTWQGFHLPFALSAMTSLLQIGTVALFLRGIRIYKRELKVAYILLAVGMVLTALGSIQFPILSGFALWQSFWATSGLIVLPYVFSGLVTYMGVRKLARLIKVRSPLTSAWVAIPSVLALVGLSIFLPHVPSRSAEGLFDTSVGVEVWGAMLIVVCAILSIQVTRHIGEHYRRAMAWLSTALIMAAGVYITSIIHTLATDSEPADLANMLINVAGALQGFIWLKAGYEFNATEEV